jgi:hypothetical protein
MEPEGHPESEIRENSGLFKSFAIYLVIFIFGFLAASFGGGVKDSIKETANLAANTAKETFSIGSSRGGEFVPLKTSGSNKVVSKTSNIVGSKTKPSLPTVIPDPVVDEKVAAPSSSETIFSPTVLNESGITTTVTSSVSAVAQSLASAQSAVVVPSNSNESNLHPLIYEVRITGGAGKSAEDYIKIFNPSPKTLDLSGWRLRKRTQSGSESSIRVFPDGTSLSGGKILIWANNSYASVVGAELMSSQTLAANNSVGLLNKDGILIDAVGWGEIGSIGFIEGSAYPLSPEENQVLLRRQSGGFLVDTQNNAEDFEIY